jgi:dihydropyrimidinase
MSQLLIKGGTYVNPGGSFEGDLLIDEGRIVAVGEDLGKTADRVIDGKGKVVLPGGIDAHVHLPWPTGNLISTDTFASGTKAAAFGGVTMLIDFVIPEEGQGLRAALEEKTQCAKEEAWVDYGFHLNIRGEVDGKIAEVPELVKEGFPSFKVFMAYDGFQLDDSDLLRVMRAVSRAGGLLSVHAENGDLADTLTADLVRRGDTALCHYPHARCAQCEIEAIQRIIAYSRIMGNRLHVHHVSTAKGAQLIGEARREGLPISGETCPHYLVFSSEDYEGDPVRAASLVCAPPMKDSADRAALWEALASHALSVLATDHCPYTRDQKEANLEDFTHVPGGLPGVEIRLPIVFTEGVARGRLSLNRFVEIWATEPARVFGLYPAKGWIAPGCDADLVMFNPKRESVLRAEELHMNTDCVPYEGRTVRGYPVTTILGGEVIVEGGQLTTERPRGRLVRRYLNGDEPSREER